MGVEERRQEKRRQETGGEDIGGDRRQEMREEEMREEEMGGEEKGALVSERDRGGKIKIREYRKREQLFVKRRPELT